MKRLSLLKKTLLILAAIVGVFVILLVLLLAHGISETKTTNPVPSITDPRVLEDTSSWAIYSFQASGLPNLTFRYPAQFGKPFFQYEATGNDATVTFYGKTGPGGEDGHSLGILLSILPPNGRTFEDNNALLSDSTTTNRYFSIDGRKAYETSGNPELYSYLIDMGDGSELSIIANSDATYLDNIDANGESTMDKIIESIRFQ